MMSKDLSQYPSRIPVMSEQEFDEFSTLIYARCGIKMPPAKKTMLTGRLAKRLRSLGISSFKQYFDYVCHHEGAPSELQTMINLITTNKTDFFREPKHFDYLTKTALPEIIQHKQQAGDKSIHLWSAGCSTGEEPYTMAMVINDYFEDLPGWRYSLLATDLSTRVLEQARLGIYDHQRIEPLPNRLRRKYLMRSKINSDQVRFIPSLRAKITFKQLNFMDRIFAGIPESDVIFCRNVLIYFDRKTQEKVINRFCEHLKPEGYLFLGHSESIQGYRVPLTTVKSTIYRKTAAIPALGVGFLNRQNASRHTLAQGKQ